MSIEKDTMIKNVLEIIYDIAESINNNDMLNERYLHHLFSHQIQEKTNLIVYSKDESIINLHPEWATWKKKTNIYYSRYLGTNKVYYPDSNGGPGFIDFAIGSYKKPDIGIEFTLNEKWKQEDIVYDFLKMLDGNSPFTFTISFNVLFRRGELSKGKHLINLKNKMNDAYTEAVKRLKDDVCDDSRNYYFILSEIAKDNSRRHWHYNKRIQGFREGFPDIGIE
jgi:hypothetical protein